MKRAIVAVAAAVLCVSAACHPGPVFNTGPKQSVGGTIAGIVSTSAHDGVPGRTVTAVSTSTGQRFAARTGVDGGYTIQVPRGTYRIELELRTNEAIAEQPPETHITRSDIDASRDFVITAKAP